MQPVFAAHRQMVFLLLALIVTWPRLALALSGSQVYALVKDSVVVVGAYDRAGKAVGLGSGVVLPSGEIVTNWHVIKGGTRYAVGQRGKTAPAFLQGKGPDKDLALLLAPGLTAAPARVGQASRLKVGEKVFAVGSPQGLELSLSEGIVSQLRGGPPPIIQTTVAISQGSSGGGLFNDQGELVGITTFYLKEGQGLNFALPVELLEDKNNFRFFLKVKIIDDPEAKKSLNWAERAEKLKKDNDWQGLLAHCRQWTQSEPTSADAWFDLGMAFGVLGRHQEAIEANRKGLRLKPDNAAVWYNLGVSYGELGRLREAIAAYREALRLKPDFAGAWVNLGVAYGKMGRYREAVEAYREALRLQPDDADAWNGLGFAYEKLGRHREAIEAYREALRFQPNFPDAWNNLALAYYQSGNRAAALQALKELRRYDPKGADELFNLIMKP